MVTATDFFCGAGGSSTGLVAAGIEVRMAVNHWQLAIDTHNTNHPSTDHDLADLQQTHASRYRRTDIAWFSPECQSHSLAKGRKRKAINQLDLWGENRVDPAEERSRATMREVVEFSEYHRYEVVIVENVVDIRHWQHYDTWLNAMFNLGYEHRVLYLNSQFFGVPQSRDRFYAVFWKRGNKAPDLDFRPPAWCTKCEDTIHAIQNWKRPEYRWGRYGDRRQYVYSCPKCGTVVQPGVTPAWVAIDWSLPAQLIGERAAPLKPKTLERIKAGIRKFARPVVIDTLFTHTGSGEKVRPVDEPLATQTQRQSLGMAVPPYMVVLKNSWSPDGTYTLPPRNLDEPLTTVVASASQHALVMPPFSVSTNHSDDRLRSAEKPLDTVMPHTRPSIVIPAAYLLSYYNNASEGRSLDDPMYTIATRNTPAIVIHPYIMSYYSRDDAQSSVDAPIPTIPTENRHSLVIPPAFVAMLRKTTQATGVDEPIATIVAGAQHHALVSMPFLTSYYGAGGSPQPTHEPMHTVTTKDRHALVVPELVDEEIESILMASRFRMLEPGELKLGMSFPGEYIVLGSKRDQVRQIGNAVCCNVAEWIGRRCLESLL